MIFGVLSTKIKKEEQRSCKGVYFAKFDAQEVKKKCQIKGIIAFLRSNILKVANYMTSLPPPVEDRVNVQRLVIKDYFDFQWENDFEMA